VSSVVPQCCFFSSPLALECHLFFCDFCHASASGFFFLLPTPPGSPIAAFDRTASLSSFFDDTFVLSMRRVALQQMWVFPFPFCVPCLRLPVFRWSLLPFPFSYLGDKCPGPPFSVAKMLGTIGRNARTVPTPFLKDRTKLPSVFASFGFSFPNVRITILPFLEYWGLLRVSLFLPTFNVARLRVMTMCSHGSSFLRKSSLRVPSSSMTHFRFS